MKLKPHVSLGGSSINSPFRVFLSTRAPKNCPSMTKISRGQDTHCLSVYQIWGLFIFFNAMNADKWLWPIFICKVGQSVQIEMKLDLDVWRYLLDVCDKFQTDISKHVQNSGKLFAGWELQKHRLSSVFVRQRTKNYPTMTKISREQDTHNISVCQIWGLYMILGPWMRINDWPIFGCKAGQSVSIGMKLELTCNTTYCMYIPSFKLMKKGPGN